MDTSLTTQIEAEALSLALEMATKIKPFVTYYDDGHAEITFNEKDIPSLQSQIENLIKKPPGNVKLNYEPVVFPVALKKIIPAALLLIAGGYLLGRAGRKK